MPVVTHHETDNEEELRIQHPHLSPEYTRQLVREQHSDLWVLHHQGYNSADEAAPTVDPGQLINELSHKLLANHTAHNFTQAVEIASRQLPEAAAAYHGGLSRRPSTPEVLAEDIAGPVTPCRRPHLSGLARQYHQLGGKAKLRLSIAKNVPPAHCFHHAAVARRRI